MNKKTSVILKATIALVLTFYILALPSPALAGVPGAPGKPGHPGKAGIGSLGGSAYGGLGGNANDGAAVCC